MEVREPSAKYLAKPAYKQTEVGVIPADWECSEIGPFIDLLTGFPFPSKDYVPSGIRLLRGSNIKRGNTDWSEDLTAYWPSVSSEIRKYVLEVGDVVVAMDGSLVGKSFASLSEVDIPALLLQRVARIRSSQIKQSYLRTWICSPRFTEHCDVVKTTTAIPHISPSNIRSFKIALPPRGEEQQAIAEALSDADALIESLDQLLAKKRQIKQGAMQELLTGQKRLPGFSGEWEQKPMHMLGQTYGGLTGKSKADFGHGSARYIPFMNVMNSTVIDPNWLESVDVAPGESQNLAQVGDLFFNGSSETPEEVGFCSMLKHEVSGVYLNSFCFGFRFHPAAQADGLFLSYWFRSQNGRKAMSLLAQGATRYNIAKSAFLKLEVPQPSSQEQTAIATVLADLDAETAALEARLAKARLLKQGMMQELLTGRIRLV